MNSSFLGLPDFDALLFFGFVTASFFTSCFGMVTGAGGGPILLALMSTVLPPAVLIPVHTVVQLGVGSSRAVILWRFILTPTVLPFFIGSLVGAGIAAPIFVRLPDAVLRAVVAIFILVVAWFPHFGRIGPERGRFTTLGFFATFLAMFVSSTGPLVAPFVAAISPDRRNYASTTSALLSLTHIVKLVAFGLMGFSIGTYLPLMVGMVCSAVCGNIVGRHILDKVPERLFRVILKALLTFLALRLLWVAVTAGA